MLANRVESWFEEWKQQGLEEGRSVGLEEGREEGMKKGELSGRAALLEKQLRLKFGALDDSVPRRLHSATADELDLWAERILFASRLEDVMQ